MKLTYATPEDNLIRHRGDRCNKPFRLTTTAGQTAVNIITTAAPAATAAAPTDMIRATAQQPDASDATLVASHA